MKKKVVFKIFILFLIELVCVCKLINLIKTNNTTQTCTNIILQSNKKSIKQKQRKFLSSEDKYLIEKMIMAESGNEPYTGQIAVANVILNRLESKKYPNTVKGVLFQKHQFSPISDKRFFKITPNNSCKRALEEALSGRKVVDKDVYYFMNKKIAKDFYVSKHCKFVRKIGNHWFYKNNEKTKH